jgi:phenylacetate-CoA ligase
MIKFVQLRKLLAIASNLPTYSQRFLEVGLTDSFLTDASDSDLLSLFTQIPPVTKEELRDSPEKFLAEVNQIAYRGATSGTTAEALIYFRDCQWNHKRKTALSKFLSWWDIDDNLPIINLNSRLFPLRENDYSLIGILDDFFWQSLKIATENPVVFRGFPSRLCEVAMLMGSEINLSSIKAIICTGEPLFPHQKQLLTDTFATSVINEYGSQECGIHGFSCPICDNIHVEAERCLVEVNNNQLIATDLYSNTMPLIRYYNGDLVELEKNYSCPHGDINLRILGRKEDNLRSIANYPILPDITYYRSLPNIQQIPIIGYLPRNFNPNLQHQLANSLSNNFGQFYQFTSPLEFYRATIVDSETNLSQNKPIDDSEEILKFLTSKRWIFYHLPSSLHNLFKQINHQEKSLIQQDKIFILVNVLGNKNSHDFENELIQIFLKYQTQDQLSLIYLDLLIVALFLQKEKLWFRLKNVAAIEKITLDQLTYHLLLTTVAEVIKQGRRQKKPPLITKLTPLLPLFISDLDYAQIDGVNFLGGILLHWAILLNCLSDTQEHLPSFFMNPLPLQAREMSIHHQQYIYKNNENLSTLSLSELKELGIKIVLFNLDIDPDLYLEVMTFKLRENKQQEISKKLGFIPFMRHLANIFLTQGKRKKAYQCLLMSQDISLMQDNFESLSKIYNFKQKIF